MLDQIVGSSRRTLQAPSVALAAIVHAGVLAAALLVVRRPIEIVESGPGKEPTIIDPRARGKQQGPKGRGAESPPKKHTRDLPRPVPGTRTLLPQPVQEERRRGTACGAGPLTPTRAPADAAALADDPGRTVQATFRESGW